MVIETTNILLGVVIFLTLFLVFIGAQILITLNNMKRTYKKAHQVLDEAEEILGDIALPIRDFSSALHSLHTTGKILQFFLGDKKGRKVTKEIASEGRGVLSKLEDLMKNVEEESDMPRMTVRNSLDVDKEEKVDRIESIVPSSFLSAPKRLFKGIPKRR
jgi:hypothetical protein